MVAALFDTNIVIDYLNGIGLARDELALYGTKSISIVTWMEVLVGAPPALEIATRGVLDGFTTIPIESEIAERAVLLRKTHRLRLPDAIILATAECKGLILVTRDSKDFYQAMPGVRIPYQL